MSGPRQQSRKVRCAAAVAALVSGGAGPSIAGEAEWRAAVQTEFTYSDNLNLAPKGQEQSGFANTTRGELAGSYSGPRLNAQAFATLAVDTFLDDRAGDNRVRGYLGATGQYEVVPNQLYFDGAATVQQVVTNGDGKLTLNPLSTSNDSETIGSLTLSPFYRGRIGGWGQVEVRYIHQQFGSLSNAIDHVMVNTGRVSVESGEIAPRLTIGALVEASLTDSENDLNDVERATFAVTGRYAVSPRLALLARAGYDKVNSDAFTRDDPDGPYLAAGFEARPTARTYLRALAGTRYDDFDLEVEGRYQVAERVFAGVNYYQTISTTSQSLFNTQVNSRLAALGAGGTPSEAVVQQVEAELVQQNAQQNVNFGVANAAYRSHVLTGYVTGEFGRNRLYLNVTGEQRDFDIGFDDQGITFVAGAERQFTGQLSGALQALYRHFETDDATESDTDTYSGRASLSYAITPQTSATVSVEHTTRSATFSADEYDENSVIVGLRHEF